MPKRQTARVVRGRDSRIGTSLNLAEIISGRICSPPSEWPIPPEDAPAVRVADPILVRQIRQQRFKLRVEFLQLRFFLVELIEPVLNGLVVTAVRAARIHCAERDALNVRSRYRVTISRKAASELLCAYSESNLWLSVIFSYQ